MEDLTVLRLFKGYRESECLWVGVGVGVYVRLCEGGGSYIM
jgi:hypothetical protein